MRRLFVMFLPFIALILSSVNLASAQSWSDVLSKTEAISLQSVGEADLQRQRDLVSSSYMAMLARIPKGLQVVSDWERFVSEARLAPQFDNPAELQRVVSLLGKDLTGMEWEPLQHYRHELRKYLLLRAAAENASLASEFEKHKAALLVAMKECSTTGAAEQQVRLANELHWHTSNGQMSGILEKVKGLNRHNNIDVRVSRKLLGAYVRDSFVRPQTVRDCILDTAIHGNATVCGQSDVELVNDNSHIRFDIVVRASVQSDTVGLNGPVKIYSGGATQIVTHKPVVFDGRSLIGLPAYSHAQTNSFTKAIDTKFKGMADRLVTRIAAKQVEKKKDEGNAIAARHAERDTNLSVDKEVNLMLHDGNDTLYKEYTRPATIRGFLPQRYDLATLSEQIRFATSFAGNMHLSAAKLPVSPMPIGDVSAQIHQSMANNMLDIYLAGKTFSIDELVEYAAQLQGGSSSAAPSDKPTKPKSSSKPTRFTLESRYPVELVFDKQQVFMNIRAKTVQIDKQIYSAMNIGLRFNIRQEAGRWMLEFEGEPVIVPSRVELDPEAKLSGPEVAIRRILRNIIARDLPKTTPIDSIPLKKESKTIGTLAPTVINTSEGWLSFGAAL